jgi:hypothetical protein
VSDCCLTATQHFFLKSYNMVIIREKCFFIFLLNSSCYVWGTGTGNNHLTKWLKMPMHNPNLYILLYILGKYIIMKVICLSDLGNSLPYYLDKTTLISLLYWVSNFPGNMPKYYPGNMQNISPVICQNITIPNITTETYTKYNNTVYI